MTTPVYGKLSLTDTPDVNGLPVVLTSSAQPVPQLFADISVNRPPAGSVGRIYIDTNTNQIFRDDGTLWNELASYANISGTANQISVVAGTSSTPSVVSIASNPIIPGTASMRPPVGTTAQRPGTPGAGDQRFNTTLGYTEEYNGSNWSPMGRLLQMVTGPIPASSGTTTVPLDNTVPTSTEGWQVFSTAFTPMLATSRIIIMFSVTCSMSASGTMIGSMFAGTTNIGSNAVIRTSNNAATQMTFTVLHVAASTATITFSFRFGGSAASTTYINQFSATLGGALASDYMIMEYA